MVYVVWTFGLERGLIVLKINCLDYFILEQPGLV